MYKLQATVLTGALILVGMMFLIPAITDKALGAIDNFVWDYSKFKVQCCTYHLQEGQFTTNPTVQNEGNIFWSTQGKPVGGLEAGYITATIKFEDKTASANFGWSNPTLGDNNCVVNIDPPLKGILKLSCYIGGGALTEAFYCIDGKLIRTLGSHYYYNACSASHPNTSPNSK